MLNMDIKRGFKIVESDCYSVLLKDGVAVASAVDNAWECFNDEDQDDVIAFLDVYYYA